MHNVEGCAGWPAQRLLHGDGPDGRYQIFRIDVHKATVCAAMAESGQWRGSPVAAALQALRGVALVVAVTVVAEVGDFRRFTNARQLMAYLGWCRANTRPEAPSGAPGSPRQAMRSDHPSGIPRTQVLTAVGLTVHPNNAAWADLRYRSKFSLAGTL
jgi:hypothetical protein